MKNQIAVLLLSLAVCSVAFAQEPPPPPPGTDLRVAKSGPESSLAGSNVTYVIEVANISGLAANGVVLTDNIPPGMTFVSATVPAGFTCTTPAAGDPGTVSCTAATLAAGASATFTFVFQISSDTAPGTTFTNQATASVTQSPPDYDEENNTGVASTTTPPPPSADLGVSKSGPSSAGPDTDVVYTIVVTNNGPSAATAVSVNDTLPGTMTFVSLTQTGQPLSCSTPAIGAGGTVTCTAASYPSGSSTILTLTAHIDIETSSGTELSNTATVSSDTDPNGENDVSTSALIVSASDVSVEKTGPPTALAGENVAYTLTIANAGPNLALDVVLSDPLPPGTTFVSLTPVSGPAGTCSTNGAVTCTFTTLGSGQSSVYTLVLRAGDITSIANTATVSASTFDSDASNNSSTANTTVMPQADLVVAKTGPATAIADANITWSVTLTNSGPSTAQSVTLTDTLPPGTTFVSVTQMSGPTFTCSQAAGVVTCTRATLVPLASATFNLTAAVAPATTGTITNTAQATSGTADPNGTNNLATAPATVGPPQSDLAVMKTGTAAVTAGTNITWTVTLTNNGPSTAQTITLTDTLPAGTTFVSTTQTSGPPFTCSHAAGVVTCTGASLATQTTATFDITALVALETTGSITNAAAVTSATFDPNSNNNRSTAMAAIGIPPADVSITKTANASELFVGANAIYTIVARNSGPGPAENVVVTDTLPATVTLVSAPGCTGTTTLTCNVGTLAAGATATFTITVTLPSTPGTVTNSASVTTSITDPVTVNNTSTAAITAVAVPAGIPTVSTWGLLLMMAALAAIALRVR